MYNMMHVFSFEKVRFGQPVISPHPLEKEKSFFLRHYQLPGTSFQGGYE